MVAAARILEYITIAYKFLADLYYRKENKRESEYVPSVVTPITCDDGEKATLDDTYFEVFVDAFGPTHVFDVHSTELLTELREAIEIMEGELYLDGGIVDQIIGIFTMFI